MSVDVNFFCSYIQKLRDRVGASDEDEESLLREVELPTTLNIAAAYNELQVKHFP